MNILIIEDERETAVNLGRLITKIRPESQILDYIVSVDSAIKYLIKNQEIIDLIFMDIELTDGSSFEIFEELEVKNPIIFVTAYREFIIKSFEVNNLNYLIKPISEANIKDCFKKFDKFYSKNDTKLSLPKSKIKTRFLVKSGTKRIILLASDIELIYREDLVFAVSKGKRYIIDYSLDELSNRLDNYQFFRINRQEIINIKIITSIESYFGGRIFINHCSSDKRKLYVSQRRASSFTTWVESN